jgi:predicted RNA-binding Zn ribbon-like protein
LIKKRSASLLVAFTNEMRRRDRFREGVDALEILAVVGHHFTGAPQVVQGQGAVLAAAITLRPCPRRHLEVAVAHRAALAQDGPHFDDGSACSWAML